MSAVTRGLTMADGVRAPGAKPAMSTRSPLPREPAAGAGERPQVAGIGLVVGEDKAPKAVTGEALHDLDYQARRVAGPERHGAGPGSASGLAP